MRLSLWIDDQDRTLDEIAADVRAAGTLGYERAWLSQRGGWDVLTLLASLGPVVPGIGLGTSVVPTYPRHPLALAAQARSVQAVTSGRFALGVGVGHAFLVENQLGMSFARPARHMHEYLSALGPLLTGAEVAYRGQTLTAVGQLAEPAVSTPPLLVAALGPRMLDVAGTLADGTITTWVLDRAIGEYVAPAIARAAAAAGRPAPRIVAGICVSVTDDAEGVRALVTAQFGRARDIPHYRAAMDREGATGVGDLVVAGDETAVARALRRLADAGATELQAIPVGGPADRKRTVDALPGLVPGA